MDDEKEDKLLEWWKSHPVFWTICCSLYFVGLFVFAGYLVYSMTTLPPLIP